MRTHDHSTHPTNSLRVTTSLEGNAAKLTALAYARQHSAHLINTHSAPRATHSACASDRYLRTLSHFVPTNPYRFMQEVQCITRPTTYSGPHTHIDSSRYTYYHMLHRTASINGSQGHSGHYISALRRNTSATTTHVCQSRMPALIERIPNGVHGIATRTKGQGQLIGWPALRLSGFARRPALLRDMAYQAKHAAAVSWSALRSNGPLGGQVAMALAAANAGLAGQLQRAAAKATGVAAAVLSTGEAIRFSHVRKRFVERTGCSDAQGTAAWYSSCAESASTGHATRPRHWQCESQGRWMTAQLTVTMRTDRATTARMVMWTGRG